MHLKLLSLQKKFFYKLKRQGKVLNTIKNYQTDINCFNSYLLRSKRKLNINRFGLVHVKHYAHFLEKKYKSDNSRRRKLQTLRLFFDYLVTLGHFPSNPVRILSSPPKFLNRPKPTVPRDVKRLWNYLEQEPEKGLIIDALATKRNQVLFLLIYEGALQVSELSTLKMAHLFLGRSPRVLISPSKREPYSVPLSLATKNIYLQYKGLLKRAKKKFELNNFEELFFNANHCKILSGGISPRGIELVLKGLSEKINRQITPKSLRQSCILRWLEEEHKEELIKEWMGVAPNYSLDIFKDYLAKSKKGFYPTTLELLS